MPLVEGRFRRTVTVGELLGRQLDGAELVGAPPRLHVEGPTHLQMRRPAVGVVGSRNPTAVGAEEARSLSAWLACNRVTVVSGLAAGVDTIAHETAIKAGGRTAAVLGTPLDRQYPASNERLRAKIAAHHMVVSQFPQGGSVSKRNFVMRNRTIALISDAAIIVEAGEHSGTIHVAREALRLGRPLFVCRPAVEAGPRWLAAILGCGATMVDGYGDAFGWLLPGGQPPPV